MKSGYKRKKLNKNEIIKELCQKLKDTFELKESNGFEDFKNIKEGQCFIEDTVIDGHIRFAGHYEPQADILVNDCQFNTLGMIYVYVKEVSNRNLKNEFSDFLKACIDRASYMRDLFLRNAARKNEMNSDNHKIQARCVELVIVCPDSSSEEFGNTLRVIAQKTDYLHSIGVNLLTILDPGRNGNPQKKK